MATSAIKSTGQRTYLVQVQQLSETVWPSGFPGESWSALGSPRWMSRENSLTFDGQGEQFKSGQISARSYDTWQVPYSSDLDPDLVNVPKTRRLLFAGTVFDVIQASVIPPSRQIQLVTLAKVG
jgi:hypothetical protein